MKNLLWLVCAVALFAACKKDDQAAVAPRPTTPTPDPVRNPGTVDVAARLAQLDAAMKAHDMDKLGALYADDAVSMVADDVGGKKVSGPKAIVAWYQDFVTAFPDFTLEAQLTLINGNKAARLMWATGTNSGLLMGMPATNKKFGAHGLLLLELGADGKIKSEIHVFDPATMLAQLGVIPMSVRPVAAAGWPEKQTVVADGGKLETDNLALARKGDELWAGKKADELLAMMADDVLISDNAAPGDMKGKDAFVAMSKEFWGAFPDMTFAPQGMWAAGEWVVDVVQWTGTNSGPMPSMHLAATNKTVTLTDYQLIHIKDGKVAEFYIFHNGMAFASQLGLAPPQGDKK